MKTPLNMNWHEARNLLESYLNKMIEGKDIVYKDSFKLGAVLQMMIGLMDGTDTIEDLARRIKTTLEGK